MRKSLSTRIGIVVSVLITLSIFSFVFVYVTFEADRRTQELIEEKRSLNEILAFSIESAEYQALTWYKKYIVEKAAEPEDVVYCRLVKPAGEVFLSSIEEERGLYITDPAIHTNRTLIRNDVFNGQKIIVVISPTYRGQTLWLGFSLSKVDAAVMGILTQAIIMAVTVIVICVSISYFVVSRSLSPIKKLTNVCKHVSEGNLKVRADVQTSDEIGVLSKTFNNMITRLDRDITERKKIQEALAESEAKYRTLFERYSSLINDAIDSLESGILILDRDFKVVWINKAVEKFLGVDRDNLIGEDKRKAIQEKMKHVFEDPERFEKTLFTAYDNNTHVENFECHVLPTKYREERFLVHWSILIKTGAYAGGRIEHYYDITVLKQIEQQLLKSERLAAIGEVAAMVGHDLRNPLQAVVGVLYLAKKKLEFMPSQLSEKKDVEMLLSTIEERVEYMNKIVSDLQDYARPAKPEPVPTSLTQLINDVLSTVTVPENVKVFIEVEKDFQFPKLMVDPPLMRRVFTNLVTNALQAMPDGGQLTIRAAKKEENALISVEDTGVGIPEENLPKLFEPLFTTKSRGQGFGLPLSRVRWAKAAHSK